MPGANGAEIAAGVGTDALSILTREAADSAIMPVRRRWYVANTQCHAEARATAHLERQGFEVFCPRFKKTVRHARKTTRKLAPLFPGYMFVAMDVAREPWRSVNGTYGVIRLIMQGEMPLPVPVGIVEELQARMDAKGTVDCVPLLKIGQCVRIADGPFADLVGTLVSLDGAGRVRVLLDLLGRPVPVALRREFLLPVT